MPYVPLLPPPTPQEAIEQVLLAARSSSVATERTSLMTVALAAVDRDAASLPQAWAEATAAATRAAIAREAAIDRSYQSLTTSMMALAQHRARAADVRGVQRVLTRVRMSDAALGSSRPETLESLIAAVEAQLDAARRLRLERDRWELRLPVFQDYQALVRGPMHRLKRMNQALEDIKALAGSPPGTLSNTIQAAMEVVATVSTIAPPKEFESAHAMLLSAAQLASNAAQIRREAALTGDMQRAWDASSAAAGALMLSERARTEILNLLYPPQLSQ
jgi:hypothetical protein